MSDHGLELFERTLHEALAQVDAQLDVLRREALRQGEARQLELSLYELRTADGGWPAIPLLCARAQLLAALATL